MTTSYEGDADSTAAARLADGWFRTGDLGCLDADGILHITGRIKEMINRGGEKIAPAEIDAALAAHPEVLEAGAFGFPHPTLGEEIAAAVILDPDAVVTPEELKGFASRHLAPFKVPKKIVIADSLPHGPTGKLQRYILTERFGPDPSPDQMPPSGNLAESGAEAVIARIWAEELGHDTVGLDDDFFVLGGDSLQAARIFLRIEEELGHKSSVAALYTASTVRAMAHLLESGPEYRHLVAIRPDGHLRPFFCVRGGAGNVVGFRDLGGHLHAGRPFYGLQARGVDGAATPLFDIEDMAAAYIEEIKVVQPEGPYVLGGYSSGGLIAHAMAVQLQAQGENVAALALLDSYSSSTDESASPRQAWRRHRDQIRRMTPSAAVPFLRDRLAGLYRHGYYRLRSVIRESRIRAGRAPLRTSPTESRIVVEFTRLARRTYRPKPFDGSATLFRAIASLKKLDHRYADWPNLVTGGFEIQPVPGNHGTIILEPDVKSLAAALDTYFSAADPDL